MKRRSDKGRKAQMKISFGLIFSIILIIVFIGTAFFGIKKFLVIQNQMKMYSLMDDLNHDVDKMWRSSSGSQKVSYIIPKGIDGLCFKQQELDSEENNVYFIEERFGIEGFEGIGEIFDHLNWLEIEGGENYHPEHGLCFLPEKSRITMLLSKDYDELEVTVEEYVEPEEEPLTE